MDARAHRLFVCEDGRTVTSFPVALGEGGLGKRVRGDRRTPLGLYPLGTPRTSASFGTFIPVGYPTRWQQRLGFTGDAIGLHGPPRNTLAERLTNVATDWTWGCIALASDEEIGRLAAWVEAHPAAPLLVS